jgi:antibiotic biosynthesis monooxygenase (ABM) superfamily enzyme
VEQLSAEKPTSPGVKPLAASRINSIKNKQIQMIHITQLIYVKKGKEAIFHAFEEIAIPTILKYNGRLTLRIRPTKNSVIEHTMDVPYEIHLVEFDSQEDFDNFMIDEERKKFLHLKEQSIESAILIQGVKLN